MLWGFALWAGAAAAATLLAGTLYVSVQQSYRQGANDPQIEIAEDISLHMQEGAAILDQVPKDSVDVGKSLSPFVIMYDTEGNPIAGNGYLNQKLIQVPKGVFDAAQASGENRLTLEPQSGVRIAAVIKPFVGREASGYVLAGRSLREVEQRESDLTKLVALGWAGTLAVLLVAAFLNKIL